MQTVKELAEKTFSTLQLLQAERLDLPEEMRKRCRKENQGELCLENHFFRLQGKGELRSAVIVSEKIEIATFMFFPQPECAAPLYACEFVILAQRPIIAVIDAKCLLKLHPQKDRIRELLQNGAKNLDDCNDPETMPPWYLEARSGNDIFRRAPTPEQMARLLDIHLQLWEQFVPLLGECGSHDAEQTSEHQKALRHYKHQHRINSPAAPLLERSFGSEWTEKYLSDYLFA